MYDLSDVLPVEAATEVHEGSTLLVSGPPLAGREEFAFDVLADGFEKNQGTVAVTTEETATKTVEAIQSRTTAEGHHQIAAIDCRGDDSSGWEQRDGGGYVQRVTSPANLTDIGIGITQSFDRLGNAGVDRGRLALTSLSTMLTYTDAETVFKFCHVLSSRLDTAGYLGVFTIDPGAHDDQTIQIVKQAFDGLVELRETDGKQARVRGLGAQSGDWIDLPE